MTNEDKIVDRVRKLLELANSDNVHEAGSAAKQAQILMSKHNISEAMVSVEADADEQEDLEVDMLHQQGGRPSPERFRQVAMAIGFEAGDGHKKSARNHSPAIVADRRYRARDAGNDRGVRQVSKPRRGLGTGAGCSHESAAIIAANIGSNAELGIIRVSPNTTPLIDRLFI